MNTLTQPTTSYIVSPKTMMKLLRTARVKAYVMTDFGYVRATKKSMELTVKRQTRKGVNIYCKLVVREGYRVLYFNRRGMY